MVSSILVGAGLLVFGVFLYGLNLRARWRLRHFPGPRPTWLMGNLPQMKAGMHITLPQLAQVYGPIYRILFGRFPVIVVSDPDMVKEVCVSKFMSYHDRQYNMVNMGGNDTEANCTMQHGMLSAKGKYWTGLRASVERVFHSGQLAAYAPLMNEAAEKLNTRLAAKAGTAAEEGAAAGIGAVAAPVAAAPAGATHEDGAAAGEGGDADAAAVAGKAAAQGEAAEAAAGATAEAALTSINLSAALATMTLEVIGTSAFGVEFDTSKEDSRIVQEARFVMDPPKRPNSLNRMGGILIPELGRLWFLLSSWTGSEAVRGSFKARGFLLGTSQVLLQNARQQDSAGTTSAATGVSEGAVAPHAAAQAAAAAPPKSGLFGPDPDLRFYHQAKADARAEYGAAVPRDGSLLHHLLRAHNKETGKPFSELQIMAQGNTFLLAGYETTSMALMFAIIGLSQNPDVEAKLLAEVDAFAWKDGAGVGFDDIKESFPYTRAVIDEAMRMWPPVTPIVGLQREASANTSIGRYRVAKGEKVWINVMALHHDPAHWPQPEVFRPERFLKGSSEAAGRHPFAYLPFGAGPRKCVGYRFALEEAVITLAQLYRRFTFRLDSEKHPEGKPLELSHGITLNVKGGCWVTPLPR